MKSAGWQKTWVRYLTTALTLGMMVLIFSFSTETAEKSDKTSGAITQIIVKIAFPDYESYTEEMQIASFEKTQHIVRKAAHYSEYTLLGLLIRLCFESWFGKKKGSFFISWGAGTLYAVTDEIHQLLIDGRSGQWTDVLIDSCGVITGVLIAILILRRTYKIKENHP